MLQVVLIFADCAVIFGCLCVVAYVAGRHGVRLH
jgi:hypothetical protein